jgi:peptide/nickel transport system substrate-binding protein
MLSKKRSSTLLAAFTVFTLVAGACGSDDNGDTKTTSSAGPIVAVTDAPTTSAGSGAATTTAASASATTTAASSAAPTTAKGGGAADLANHHVTDPATPVKGGTLVYGIDSDTANAWAPYRASYAASGYIPLQAVSDMLFAVNDKGETVPLLVEKVEHNTEYTSWTLHIRSGIKFQDGTPLDGDAVKFNLDSCRFSPLTATAFSTVDTVTTSGQDVTITTKGGPWVVLPAYLTYGSCAYMLSKQWLSSLPDVPQRNEKSPAYDATLAATPANGDPQKPVGLGAFTFESYTPGNGNAFKAVRNPDYWRGPKGITGEDLPYLDAIEAVVYVDVDSRTNAVKAGDIDAMHTANADSLKTLLGDSNLKTVTTNRFGETGYILLNTAEGAVSDPKGDNAKSALLKLPCRQALAAAIDTQRYADERGGGITPPSNGPFPPGSLGYLADSGYPKYDVAKAQTYMTACLAATGTSSIELSYNTTNDPFNVESNQLVISMWNEAFGDKVKATITPIEQGSYIGLALLGTFQAQGWRNHGGLDPDQQRLWWQTASATPVGVQALNFGRFKDTVIDDALTTIKSNPDPAARKAAAEALNKEFGAQVWNIWLNWSVWGIVAQPYVNGV